jgi:hypothetical protein
MNWMGQALLGFGSILGIAAVLSAAACQAPSSPAAPATAPAAGAPPYVPTATIKELMLGIVDPSADVVWGAVTTVMSEKGIIETVPKTDEEWTTARLGALRLAEASNLLMMPGRKVGRPGEKSETPGVELEPEEMDALIAKNPELWNSHAKALHTVSLEALQAIDAKDSDKLFEIGEKIEVACETCHTNYWYPNEKIPPFPGGGTVPAPPR